MQVTWRHNVGAAATTTVTIAPALQYTIGIISVLKRRWPAPGRPLLAAARACEKVSVLIAQSR